ncbi:HD domain-containing protein [Candidatus Micrarchaeota archaeon]|nr:HD domain-containing protein [Candidatus Micrarchaeota archaeon]
MNSKLKKEIENLLRERVVKILEKDKSKWTTQHTLRVVYWVKKLIKEEGGNERILVPAAYLHDIGYIEVDIGKRENMDKVYSKKLKHMELGEKICKKILSEFDYYFTKDEIEKICDYVGKHDLPELKNIKIDDHDFQLLIEADSLGSIDPSLKPTFSKEDIKRYFKHFEEARIPLFKTKTGKKYLKEIYPKTHTRWLKEK